VIILRDLAAQPVDMSTNCFTARRSYASAVLVIVILSARLSHACFVTNPWRYFYRFFARNQQTGDVFMPHEKAILLVFWCQRAGRNSNGVTPDGAPNRGGVG